MTQQSQQEKTHQLSEREAHFLQALGGDETDEEVAQKLGVSVSSVKGARKCFNPPTRRITKSVRFRIRADLAQLVTKKVRKDLVEMIEIELAKHASSWRNHISSDPVELANHGLEEDEYDFEDVVDAEHIDSFQKDYTDGVLEEDPQIVPHDNGQMIPLPESALEGSAHAHALLMVAWGCPIKIEKLMESCFQDPDEIIATSGSSGNIRLQYKEDGGITLRRERERKELEEKLRQTHKVLESNSASSNRLEAKQFSVDFDLAQKNYLKWWERYKNDLAPVTKDFRIALRRHKSEQTQGD